jgi:hypothetical protein
MSIEEEIEYLPELAISNGGKYRIPTCSGPSVYARARNRPVDIVVLRSQNNQAILEVVPSWLV